MAEKTKIQWCDHTFNPWVGCAKVHTGCKFCYAEALMDTRYGRVEWGPEGTRSLTKTWHDPVLWNREAEAAGERRKVFCASLADIFEDFKGAVTDSQRRPLFLNPHANWAGSNITWHRMVVPDGEGRPLTLDDLRCRLFYLIDRCPHLNFLLLTKRPENVQRMWPDRRKRDNVWLGTSISDQPTANTWVDRLLPCRHLAGMLFLSCEPQIGPIDLNRWLSPEPLIDWVIVGGESKQGHGEPRPFSLQWAEQTIQDCAIAAVPCFLKQFGSVPFSHGQRLHLKDKHGGDMNEWPEELRIRQCPEHPMLILDW